MTENTRKKNRLLAEVLIKNLKSRNMTGYFAEDADEAREIALSIIPEGAKVTKGGSMSVDEIGLTEAMKTGNYNYFDREAAADKRAAELFAYDADAFLGSVNAMTQDGILVNIDGNSNRVSAYAYGPKKLVLVVGMNKVCPDLDSAIKRARNEAATANAQRFSLRTPCMEQGLCRDCKSHDTICCNFLVTRFERHDGRVHIILVNEDLGY